MLRYAIEAEEETNALFMKAFGSIDKSTIFYHGYFDIAGYKIEKDSAGSIQKISTINDPWQILGCFDATIDRYRDRVTGLTALSFIPEKPDPCKGGIDDKDYSLKVRTFLKDWLLFLEGLTKRYRKVSFMCRCGDRVEPIYERAVKRFEGGRVVGVRKQEAMDMETGEYIDVKLFEIICKPQK